MLELTVPDMTCGHCKSVITRAVGAIDSAAKLDFDLPSHKVSVAGEASPDEIRAAIVRAGYTVSDVQESAETCCGSCHV